MRQNLSDMVHSQKSGEMLTLCPTKLSLSSLAYGIFVGSLLWWRITWNRPFSFSPVHSICPLKDYICAMIFVQQQQNNRNIGFIHYCLQQQFSGFFRSLYVINNISLHWCVLKSTAWSIALNRSIICSTYTQIKKKSRYAFCLATFLIYFFSRS